MKKSSVLLAAVAAVSLAFAAQGERPSGKPLKVLMIGNSFSICNLKQMPPVAASMGLELDLVSLYIGGCSLERHWNNVVAASTNATFKPYRFDRITDGTRVVEKDKANIPDALVMDKWDVVTIQQASHFSWRPETYQPFGDSLVAKIRELAPQAKIVVQETWSYPPWDKRLKDFGFDQAEMYTRLHGSYALFAAKYGFDVIPVGTAAEFVPERNTLFTKPDFHFNRDGEYLQGLAFTAKLFGVDVRKCAYRPAWMEASRAEEIKAAVMDAIKRCGRDSGTTYVADALAPYVERGELPGAVSILDNDGVVETACVGYADVAAKRRITADDVYMQCSQTKGFCGVTVAKLVEEGKLNLDDPVSKYLPEFRTLWIKGPETNDTRTLVKAKNVLTVRMCLNHTGGFPFEISAKQGNIKGGGWSGGAPLRQTAAIAAASPILFEPGTKQKYSNTGIDIGAAVVEVVTGMKWEDYLKENVLDPLGMKSTWFWPTDEQLKTQVEMYDCHDGAPATWKSENPMEQRPYNDGHVFASAGAGLWTTANDQYKFYRMLMNLGVGDNGARILKEETVKSILAVSTRPAGLGGYSLGLAAPEPEKDGEDAWFGHGGAWGTNCMVNWRRRQLKLWAVQLNGGPRPWDKAKDAAADKFFRHAVDNSGVNDYTGRVK